MLVRAITVPYGPEGSRFRHTSNTMKRKTSSGTVFSRFASPVSKRLLLARRVPDDRPPRAGGIVQNAVQTTKSGHCQQDSTISSSPQPMKHWINQRCTNQGSQQPRTTQRKETGNHPGLSATRLGLGSNPTRFGPWMLPC
jgi:hypothetical protein